jgi:hypothetical protein
MPAGRDLGERQFVALSSEGVQDGKTLGERTDEVLLGTIFGRGSVIRSEVRHTNFYS